MKVIKRDGRKVDFDKSCIETAVLKAFKEVDGEITKSAKDRARDIAKSIGIICLNGEGDVGVEEIQDLVEEKLMASHRKDVAKAYVIYRNDRNRIRQHKSPTMQAVRIKLAASDVQNQNANVDEHSFGGRMGEANEVVTKEIAINEFMSPMARNNHVNNMIYEHDAGHFVIGDHNCLSIPYDDLLANGANTRQTDIRPAASVGTAFQLIAVYAQLQSLQQYGGVSATHLDWTMVPYVRKSFHKHFKDGVKYIADIADTVFEHVSADTPIDSEEYPRCDSYDYAMDMTLKELKQAVEGLYHNLNTLQSRSGNQLPFTSINYGTCTLLEGRMVTKALLDGSLAGVGKFHKTPIFPCGIFQCMKGVNRAPGDPNYDLFKLALKSTAQRLYPNYANVDWSGNAGYDINDPKTYFSTMGKCKLQLM